MGMATILVVDDERKIRVLVRSYLEREGYSVLVADTGQRALETLERARPDLLVLDLMLPDLSGEEIARSVRSHSRLPIIMLTAKATEDDRGRPAPGGDDYLVNFSPRGWSPASSRPATLRRVASPSSRSWRSIDRQGCREVRLQGELAELTRSEFDLLPPSPSPPGRVLTFRTHHEGAGLRLRGLSGPSTPM
jgi:DNA-binding response OmpR family regulator